MGLFNKIKDSLTASEFDVKGQTKVKTLKKHFAEEFGCTLRVYYGKGKLLFYFKVPKNQKGDIWKVFQITNGKVVPVIPRGCG